MGRISGKVALITGGGSRNGIGFATARAFASEGGRVVLTGHKGFDAELRAAELRDEGAEIIGLEHDVRHAAAWASVFDAAVATFGRVDILVNNAGVAIIGGIDNVTEADWGHHIAVNATGVFLGCKFATAQMRKQGGGGAIINVSSTAGIVGIAYASAYCASKGAVRLLTKSLALELASDGIRVNSVHPGIIATDIQPKAGDAGADVANQLHNLVPVGRLGEPVDVAMVNLFLASDEAKYVTGSEYIVDGGMTSA